MIDHGRRNKQTAAEQLALDFNGPFAERMNTFRGRLRAIDWKSEFGLNREPANKLREILQCMFANTGADPEAACTVSETEIADACEVNHQPLSRSDVRRYRRHAKTVGLLESEPRRRPGKNLTDAWYIDHRLIMAAAERGRAHLRAPPRTSAHLRAPSRTPAHPHKGIPKTPRPRQPQNHKTPVPSARDSDLPALPWHREQGLTSKQLSVAVRLEDRRVLDHLFREAVEQEWIRESEHTRCAFYAAAHHAVTHPNTRDPKKYLTAMARNGLDVSRCRQASDDFARRMLAQRHRDPSLSDRLCSPN